VASVVAGGTTDILTPLQQSFSVLSKEALLHHAAPGRAGPLAPTTAPALVPIVFLITDGAVAGEQDICMHVRERNEGLRKIGAPAVRVFTFGIGACVRASCVCVCVRACVFVCVHV
jgi:hypothetical protein